MELTADRDMMKGALRFTPLALLSAICDSAALVAKDNAVTANAAANGDATFMVQSGISAPREMCLTVGGGRTTPPFRFCIAQCK